MAASTGSSAATGGASPAPSRPLTFRPPVLDPERRSALLGAKLGALVRDRFGPGERQPGTFPGGATLQEGGRAWVLLEDDPGRSLGRALAWGRANGTAELHVLAEADTGLLARRAAAFAVPPTVWRVDGRAVERAEPAPAAPPAAPHPSAELLSVMLAAAGADVVVEHGVVSGEVRGLEIARVAVDDDGTGRIEVGVGRHDREAFAMVHGDVPPAEALADVIGTVRRHRHPDAPHHPLNRLAGERWLRATVVADPALVGAAHLRPVDPPVPRANVKDPVPAPALGEDLEGRPLVAVCSVGVDLDLVPSAADARAVHAPGARLVLVVPERDDLPVTRALAAALAEPAEVVPVPGDWRR